MDDVTDPTPRQQSIEKAIEQARSANARNLARLRLDQLRMALGSVSVADYVDMVGELRDEGDEAGARAVQELRFPPDDTPPSA